jgi:hypothetical protein
MFLSFFGLQSHRALDYLSFAQINDNVKGSE